MMMWFGRSAWSSLLRAELCVRVIRGWQRSSPFARGAWLGGCHADPGSAVALVSPLRHYDSIWLITAAALVSVCDTLIDAFG
mmetsp:Transcript_62333/g.103663  ORF Transcript_62333/g.103663 Transcript_62333/m.103663 type:complete len:82 (+) Transcript_62333:1294-1539(+)